MSRDITEILEAEYERTHDETDDKVVIGQTCQPGAVSDEPFCSAPGDDVEQRF